MFPKKIWRYWAQGWENAPFMVRYCTEAVQHYAPDWEIINLDDKNIGEYIDLPAYLKNSSNFPIQPISDLIRVKLLDKYGGVWLDATAFLNTNLTAFLTPLDGEFFCFWRWEKKVSMSSWFLAASKGSYICNRLAEDFEKLLLSNEFLSENEVYFSKWRGSPNYFAFHKLLEKLTKEDIKFNSIINNMTFIDSTPLLMPQFNGWNKDISHEYLQTVLKNYPVIKLTHLIKEENYNTNSILEVLLKKMKGASFDNIPHFHLSNSMRPVRVFNSFINLPSKVKYMAGSFESEGDLKLCKEKYSRYHIYNFPSVDEKHGVQLLIPYEANRLFLRSQKDNTFSIARELAYRDEIETLKKEIETLRHEFFWERIFDKIVDIIPPGITPSYKFDKIYTQFFIDGVNNKIHYELQIKDGVLYICIHCEDTKLSDKYYYKFDYLSKLLEEKLTKNNGNLAINKRIDIIFLRSVFVKFFEVTHNHVCSMV